MRYNGEGDYTTITGGFSSLIIIIIFIALFASQGVLTVNQSIINSASSIENDVNPPFLSVITSPANAFMFSINI
jgi:hypothetical protein